jgi:hypothetical protein
MDTGIVSQGGGIQGGGGGNHTLPSSAEVKNDWSCAPVPPLCHYDLDSILRPCDRAS